MMEQKIGQATIVEGFGLGLGIPAQGERPNFKPYEPLAPEVFPGGSPKDVFITSWAKSSTTMIQLANKGSPSRFA